MHIFKLIFLFLLVTFIYKATPQSLFDYSYFFFLEQYITIVLPVFCFVLYELWRYKIPVKNSLGLGKFHPSVFIFCLAIFVLIQPINYYLSELTALFFGSHKGEESELDPFYIGLFNIALMPAICEEILFRGMILHYQRKFMQSMMAIVMLNGFLFGLFHLNIEQFFYTFFMGAIFTYMSLISGSIYPAVITHFLNNLFTTFTLPMGFDYIQQFEPIENIRMVIVLLTAIFGLFFVLKKMKAKFN